MVVTKYRIINHCQQLLSIFFSAPPFFFFFIYYISLTRKGTHRPILSLLLLFPHSTIRLDMIFFFFFYCGKGKNVCIYISIKMGACVLALHHSRFIRSDMSWVTMCHQIAGSQAKGITKKKGKKK